MSEADTSCIGFIGLGTMGEPMCRNLATRSGYAVIAYDVRPEPLERLREVAVRPAADPGQVAAEADFVMLSLPGGAEVEQVCLSAGGLIEHVRRGQTIVDLSTAPMALAERLAAAFADRGVAFADAPVARTRQAAQDGTLSIMVGADEATFTAIRPLLACMASEITHCGGVGAGQVVKALNNMVLFETVAALAEALAIGRGVGVDGKILFETLAKGSADSFALRNHGMKAMLPGVFPVNAFSTEYAMKDLSYALGLAAQAGIDAGGARNVADLFEKARRRGRGDAYFPVVLELLKE
ncbi:MAG: NAD(P)-dependent oxidoreductase [Hyphomicrobiaceae bacterium]|nr:NAD(P)-dependent oxidoreductase [Hyphomicrobiaceae bacterium]